MQHEPNPASTIVEGVVSRPLMHDSAVKHVTGMARYVDDVPEPAGTLHIAPAAATIAHGRILSMDLAAVRAAPGVVAVLTAEDVPGRNDVSPVDFDVDPCFAEETIEFHAQVLFAVVARTRDEARRAARLAVVDYARETAIVTVDE